MVFVLLVLLMLLLLMLLLGLLCCVEYLGENCFAADIAVGIVVGVLAVGVGVIWVVLNIL